MSYDGLLAAAVCSELKSLLPGSKIEKISQPETDQLVLQIRTGEGRVKLLIDISSQGSRVQLTGMDFENPAQPPVFCMLLRKHIQGGRITDVYQIDRERIIVLAVETINEMNYSVNKLLVCETMGKYSNIILLDGATKKIIDSAKRISIDQNRYRQILPGLAYVQPPKAKLSNEFGYGPSAKTAVEVGADPSKKNPCVYLDEKGTVKDIHVIELIQYKDVYERKTFDDLTEALDFYYKNKQETNRIAQKSSNFIRQINSIIEKHQLKKSRLLEEIKKSEESDIYRIKGELLNANLHLVKPGDKKVEVISYYDGTAVTIELDEKLSAAKNAQAYYRKYAKLKSSKKEKLIQLQECEEELSYLEEVSAQISLAESCAELEAIREELYSQGFIRINKSEKRNKKTKPQPRRFTLDCGKTVLVGRSNTENDYITFRMAQKGDIWMHAKDIHGSHLILQMNGEEPEPEDIYQAAAVAAWYSKGKESDNVPVDYVPIKFVKKPAGARPGMVIFTNNRTVWIAPEDPNK